MIWICLGLLMIGSVTAQVPALGKCPTVEVKSDFDIKKYLGKWYETQKYPTPLELGSKCVYETYSLNANGTIGIIDGQTSSLTGKEAIYDGYATQDSKEKAKWKTVLQYSTGKLEGPYWVLDTDYTNYAVVWTCSDITVANAKLLWIMTRDQNPSADVLQKAHDVLTKNKLDIKLLTTTNQSNCPKDV